MKYLQLVIILISILKLNAQPAFEEVDFFLRYRLMFDDKTIVVDNANIELMNNDELARMYSMNALNKMSVNGAQSLSKEIYSLIGSK